MLRSVAFWKCLAVLLAPLSLVGCSPKVVNTPRTPAEVRLEKIGAAYARASHRLNRAPRNVEEIKPDLEDKDGLDDLLRSPGDGEPFVILWGVDFVKLPPNPKDPFTVAGYEQRGVGGKRCVLRFPLGVVQMSDEELRKAVFPPGYNPPP
jgi:hypothetical protein